MPGQVVCSKPSSAAQPSADDDEDEEFDSAACPEHPGRGERGSSAEGGVFCVPEEFSVTGESVSLLIVGFNNLAYS
jgi:hypothetical protein